MNHDKMLLEYESLTGSRIWQGRVSNPSERDTGEGEAGWESGASPIKFENLDTL